MGQRVSLCWMLCWMQASVNMMMVAGIAGAFWGARAMPSSSASATGSIRAHSAGTAGLVRQWGADLRRERAVVLRALLERRVSLDVELLRGGEARVFGLLRRCKICES